MNKYDNRNFATISPFFPQKFYTRVATFFLRWMEISMKNSWGILLLNFDDERIKHFVLNTNKKDGNWRADEI